MATPPPRPGKRPSLRFLLIDDGAPQAGLISDELRRQGHELVVVLDAPVAADSLVDRVLQLLPDLVIVACDTPGDATLSALGMLALSSPRPVVVFCENADDTPMRRAVGAGAGAYVVAGLQPQRVATAVQLAIARFERDEAMRAELQEARSALEARKRIERAKGILMRSGGIDEPSAHARLRRMAMDGGLKLEQAADRVIAADELLHPGAG